LFIEKPVSHSRHGLDELQALVHHKQLRTLVGFQFRFHPGLVAVNKLMRKGAVDEVIHVSAYWGEYLPDWHPWEDYRESYSARSDLGGGAILTLSHPFDYLRWLLGEVRAVTSVIGRNGGLGIDVEDTADIVLEFESGVTATVHLNYVEQPPCHRLRVIGRSGTILWDNEAGDVRWYRAGRNNWQLIPAPVGYERNSMFLSEAQHFLDCVTGRAEPLVSLQDGMRTLDVALAAKTSAAEGRKVVMQKLEAP
jgi:predicted dehydrogenase